MKTIILPNGEWIFDPLKQLGPRGGFGVVFAGESTTIGEVAIKEISLHPQREIRIADELLNKSYQNIIPILDAGLDTETGNNYVVMVRAEKSLKDEITLKRVFEDQEVILILLQIVNGLQEVSEIVHRDLKPGNILFHSGAWKIADFGIAKFIEESTSMQTLQGYLSPQYAAPEQWEYQRPTNAVDIYSLGCIAFELLTGFPPFSGTIEELKELHLQSQPPLSQIPNTYLRTIVGLMLRKMPESRPTISRMKHLLEESKNIVENNTSGEFKALSDVASNISEKNAREEAETLRAKMEDEHRRRIIVEAMTILRQIINDLISKVSQNAPIAEIGRNGNSPQNSTTQYIKLGDAELLCDYEVFEFIKSTEFQRSGWDVLTGSVIKVKQNSPNPYVWGANLWYMRMAIGDEYRWWEVSYMINPLSSGHPAFEPFALTNKSDISDADLAASPVMHVLQFGSKPKIIDDEYMDGFINRWVDLFTKAASGNLAYPTYLPLD